MFSYILSHVITNVFLMFSLMFSLIFSLMFFLMFSWTLCSLKPLLHYFCFKDEIMWPYTV